MVTCPVRWLITKRTHVGIEFPPFVLLHIYGEVILTIPIQIETDISIFHFMRRILHPSMDHKICTILRVYDTLALRPCINCHKEHHKETNKPFHIYICLIIRHPKDSLV